MKRGIPEITMNIYLNNIKTFICTCITETFNSLYRGNSKDYWKFLSVGSRYRNNCASTAIQYKLYCYTRVYSRTMNTILAMLGQGSSLNYRERPGLEDRARPLLASTSHGRSNSLLKNKTRDSIQFLFTDVYTNSLSCSPSGSINQGLCN